jgi:hypothetical protein
MTQVRVADGLQQRALELADKWSDHYGRASVGGRLMSEDLFAFITDMIYKVEGYEEEVTSLRGSIVEQQTELVEVRQERDDLLDENTTMNRELADNCVAQVRLYALRDIIQSALNLSRRPEC